MHIGLAPEASEVLHAQHTAARLVAVRALGVQRQVALEPLVRHTHVALLVFDYLFAHGCECGPFAVVGGARHTPLMRLEFADLARQTVAGDAAERLATYVAVGGTHVRAHVPAVRAVQ